MGSQVQPSPAILILEEQRLGFMALALSEWATTGIPQIVGNVEVAGSLYTFASYETIGEWSTIPAGTCYVKVVPDLLGGITAEWTDAAPTWSDEKHGWYSSTVGEEHHRYVFSATKVDDSNAIKKREIESHVYCENAKTLEGYPPATDDTIYNIHANRVPFADDLKRVKMELLQFHYPYGNDLPTPSAEYVGCVRPFIRAASSGMNWIWTMYMCVPVGSIGNVRYEWREINPT